MTTLRVSYEETLYKYVDIEFDLNDPEFQEWAGNPGDAVDMEVVKDYLLSDREDWEPPVGTRPVIGGPTDIDIDSVRLA